MTKLKNFFNSVSNSNRIFTAEDIGEMTGDEFSKNEKAIDYQMSSLGIPTNRDLAGDSDVVYVQAYTRSDGTEVRAHYRSRGLHSNYFNNNKDIGISHFNSLDGMMNPVKLSFDLSDFINKYTSMPTGGAADLEHSVSVNSGMPMQFSTGELLEKGKPMSIPQARENINPTGDMSNCQSCVLVYEARQQGYDVSAVPLDQSNPIMMELGFNPQKAYINPKTGNPPEIKCSHVYNEKDCLKWLKDNIKPGERHIMSYIPKEGRSNEGHVLEVSKTRTGKIVFYDPQVNREFDESFIKKDVFFLPDVGWTYPNEQYPRIYRVDNAQIKPEILRKISVPVINFEI